MTVFFYYNTYFNIKLICQNNLSFKLYFLFMIDINITDNLCSSALLFNLLKYNFELIVHSLIQCYFLFQTNNNQILLILRFLKYLPFD